ncbi:MAG: hypothetical protein C4527_24115 [Candidatus Omnitrophota bacterium]|nr:MAG: hypothetical protein C4527_24115 [Candidatus Omnitrophota bacterium]
MYRRRLGGFWERQHTAGNTDSIVRCFMNTNSLFHRFLFLLVFLLPRPVGIDCCENMILRDAAFQEKRDIHRLCVMANHEDEEAWKRFADLETWFQNNGEDLNIELLRVEADQPEMTWREYGIPSAPPSLPVTVFAGHYNFDNSSFYIQHWEPGPADEDLEAIRSSPAREQIRQKIGENLAIILYAPGNDDSSPVEKILESVLTDWNQKEPFPLDVIRVDRADVRERILLSFTGIQSTDLDWLGIVFGHGTLISPPLQGEEITEDNLYQQLTTLTLDCSCLQSPSSLGVDLPMVWNEENKSQIIFRGPAKPAANDPIMAILAEEANQGTTKRVFWLATVWSFTFLVTIVILAAFFIILHNRKFKNI